MSSVGTLYGVYDFKVFQTKYKITCDEISHVNAHFALIDNIAYIQEIGEAIL